ncbi:MAG: hypothetical protein ACXVB9_07375 [Bdellovibrionota bacterium]
MGLEIQKRDLKILKLCYEQQFLLVSHIKDYLFEGNYVEAKRRVRELKAAGLLEENPLKHRRAKLIQLTTTGKRLAADQSAIEAGFTKIDPVLVEHDSIVTEVRLRLEQCWKGLWIPERALRAENLEEVPDGVMLFESGKKIAIEVENSLKGRTRFSERLKRWNAAEGTYIVLYVATNEEIYLHLKSWLEGTPHPPLFCLMRYTQLRNSEPEVWSTLGVINLFSGETF